MVVWKTKPVIHIKMAKAVSRSSRQRRPTTRQPSQTHSGLPADPLSILRASANSTICNSSAEFGPVDCWSMGLALVSSARADKFSDPGEAARSQVTAPSAQRTLATRRDIRALICWEASIATRYHSRVQHCALTMAAEATWRHSGKGTAPPQAALSQELSIVQSLLTDQWKGALPIVVRGVPMEKILTALVAAASIGAAAIATSNKAEAWGGWGWGPGAVVGGLVAGAVVGTAIASRPYYYPQGYYGYGYGPYPYYAPPPCGQVWNGYAWVPAC
jgi:hypothetical protein